MSFTVNSDKTITIVLADFKYKVLHKQTLTGVNFSTLTNTTRNVAANALETSIISELLAPYKETRRAEIRKYVTDYLDIIMSKYSVHEKDTFSVQRSEYNAYLISPSTSTPYVNKLALARGITVTAYMALIGTKIDFFATVQGKQYAAEDAIKSALTKIDVDAVALPTLP